MKERIHKLIELYAMGINFQLFNKLVLHAADKPDDIRSAYANKQPIAEWEKLYNRQFVEIGVSSDQIELFFRYMGEYFGQYFGRDGQLFFVYKQLNNIPKDENNFEFEEIVLNVLDAVL